MAPHVVQVGSAPAFIGHGSDDLICGCGGSVLIQNYRSADFIDIRIRCARCRGVTATPGLGDGEILPRSATPVAPAGIAAVSASRVPPGAVLVCQQAMERRYRQTQPRAVRDEPILLTRGMLEAAASEYNRLIGGRLADHAAASAPALGDDHGLYPLAWAVLRLRERIGRPGWSWLHQDDDAMAAMYIAAMHHLMQCWGQQPLLGRLAAPLRQPGRFLRTVAGFALAKLMFDSGNRVSFELSGSDVDLRLVTANGASLSVALLAPERLQWRERERRGLDVLRHAIVDAMAIAQPRVNRGTPGIVVLVASILQPDFDQMVVDAIHAAFRSVGRRHRGVAAIAVLMPKVLPAGLPDRLGFGYAFYPIPNPNFAGNNPVRLHSAP
ncbi:MAG TPA: hypothetical protein VH855_12665 [Acetobacteraceae bacterium]